MLHGMSVVLNPMLDEMPRMVVSPRFSTLMPPEFVADLNAWMREFFGTTGPQVLSINGTLHMGPKTLEEIRRRTQ